MPLRIVLPNKMVISKIEGELPGIEVGHTVSDIVHNNRFEQATIYLENIKDDREVRRIKELIEKSIKDQEEMIVRGLGEIETYAVRYSILVLKDILKKGEGLEKENDRI